MTFLRKNLAVYEMKGKNIAETDRQTDRKTGGRWQYKKAHALWVLGD